MNVVFIPQNVILFLTSVISYIIPDMSSGLKEQHHREKYLVNDIIISTERKIAHSNQSELSDDEMRRIRLRSRSCDDETTEHTADVRSRSTQYATTNV